MNIIYSPEESALRQQAIEKLNEYLKNAQNNPVLLLLSGGSSLTIAEGIEAKHFSQNMTIGVLDERYSRDFKINNFAKVAHLDWYAKAQRSNAQVIDTRLKNGERQEEVAERFEKGLREWRRTNPKGIIIATMGIGEDGHTAGVMPYQKEEKMFRNLFLSDEWVVSYNAGKRNEIPQRITTTLSFIKNEVDHAIVYVVNEEKKEALRNVLLKKVSMNEYPARILNIMKDVNIFTNIKI